MKRSRARLCVVTEDVAPPFDEGFKRVIAELCKRLAAYSDALILGRNLSPLVGHSFSVDKMYLGPAVRRAIVSFAPDAVLYIPMASLTVGALLRGKILQSAKSPVVVLGLQARSYSWWHAMLLHWVKPSLVVVQSRRTGALLERFGLKVELLPSGVDLGRFVPAAPGAKTSLRDRYGFPRDRKVVLHVGHVKPGRGLEDIPDLAGDALPVIVTSSSTRLDETLRATLERRGARVLRGYVERIEEVYQLADAYVFPTRDHESAIEFPLSVLEAAACGLPVLSTRFGGLSDSLPETERFAYYDSLVEGRQKLMRLLALPRCEERAAELERFGWDHVAAELLDKIASVASCA